MSLLRLTTTLVLLMASLPAARARSGEDGRDPVTVSGVLQVVVEDDFAAQTSRRVLLLEEDTTGRTYELVGGVSLAAHLTSGTRVVVRGTKQGEEIALRADEGGSFEVVEAAAAVTGARRALVLVVDFSNAAVSCTNAAVAGLMWTGAQSVDGLYRETSAGAVSFPADTDANGQPDLIRVSISAATSGSCNYGSWASSADAAAQSLGVNLAQYQHRIYVLPSGTSCEWSGLGYLGCGTSCKAWVASCQHADVYAHELGHNLGMHHASTDPDNNDAANCEYCDTSDVMGYGGVGWRQVNGAHRVQMGWLPADQILTLPSNATGVYALSPLEADPLAAPFPQVLKIGRPYANDFYYVSYRRRTGYDATLGSSYADRANLHSYNGTSSDRTLFIDGLVDGETFEDPSMALEITQLAHDASALTLSVSVGTGCPDADGDGDCDSADNCPNVSNPSQANADGDATGDACDTCTDTDGDGRGNPGFSANTCATDNCASVSNANQANADGDATGDACDTCTDTDGDGRGNPGFPANTCAVDNCPSAYNPAQDAVCTATRIDFAPAASATAAGFVKDDGSPFSAARGFGWVGGVVATRERTSPARLELDTFAFSRSPRRWSLEVPNGDYDVTVSVGDALFAQGPHRVVAEGVTAIHDVTTAAAAFRSATVRVAVRDGRLDVTIGGTAGNTTLTHLEVLAVSTGAPPPVSVNFQPAGSVPPAAYVVDSGALFDSVRGYGWDGPMGARERGAAVPQVLDTFVFTQPQRVWELALSPGLYRVWVSVGDATFAQGPQRLTVEGMSVVADESTPAGSFLERTVDVSVTDGRLTLRVGGGGGNTALNQVIVERR